MRPIARKLVAATGMTTALVIGAAAPAFAHDCINVSAQTTHASVGTFDVASNTFVPSGAPGNKPFVTIDATGVGGGTFLLYVHPAGPHGVLPAAEHSTTCDSHGVTSMTACFAP
ncbi:MAG: hypothetical protein JWO37_1008 [Acidimicrobiales bacterium]|jgi:hypothetical protein|nr:hypothetical protein [Acidimicrobiales bacterium]